MKYVFVLAAICLVTHGCAIWPAWHWERPGASDDELSWDQSQCKAKVYPGSAGAVTNETVRRMFACMEGRGWSKVEN
jgi:hypothetical protein